MRVDTAVATTGSHVHQTPSLVGPVIAVVGCDGTGKSTLTADLLAHLRRTHRAECRYLGLVSGEKGDRIKRLPFIGVRLERRLNRASQQAQNMRNKLPGTWGVIIMYGLSLWRSAHLKRVWKMARRGVWVVTDRYPQAEIPGFHYDGPGLGVERSTHWLVTRLARREQRLYEAMAQRKPTVVIRLDIDVATAMARKPDHDPAELRDKIDIMARLRFNGAHVVDIDTRPAYEQVLAAVLQAVDRATAAPRTATDTAA